MRFLLLLLSAFALTTAPLVRPTAAQTVPPTLEDAQRATALGRERLVDGDFKGAEAAVRQALEIQKRKLGGDRLEVAGNLARLALVRAELRNYGDTPVNSHLSSID